MLLALSLIYIKSEIVAFGMVAGHSMEPTLFNHQPVLFKPEANSLQRGQIVVLNDGVGLAIKRLIALPGETIEFSRNAKDVYVNGKMIIEPYLIPGERTAFQQTQKYVLKSDEFFVMGDNRRGSSDSRVYGAIHESQIKGTLLATPEPIYFVSHDQDLSNFIKH